MQGGREPGRGVYAARRIVAALVILLLLILLIPRACQALFGPGEAPGPGASGTSITSEDTSGGTENTVTEQENTPSSSSEGEIETEGTTGEIGGAVGGGEIGEVPNIEPAANLIGIAAAPEAAVGGSDIVSAVTTEPTPASSVDTESQLPPPPHPPPPQEVAPAPLPLPAVQPIAFEEPVFLEEPFPSGKLFPAEAPVTFQEEAPSNTMATPTSNTFASVATDRVGPEAVAGAAVAIA